MDKFIKEIEDLRSQYNGWSDIAREENHEEERQTCVEVVEVLSYLLERAPRPEPTEQHKARYNKHFSRSNN